MDTNQESPALESERLRLTLMVMQILEDWGATGEQQRAILSLPENIPVRALARYRQNTPLPDTPEIAKALEHILGIADALRTMFPGNPRMAGQWMRRPHRRMEKKSPLVTMTTQQISGLMSVRAELDCTYAWDLTGSR